MATEDEIKALFAQFNDPNLTPFGQPQTLAGLGFEQPSWMAQATPQAVMPEATVPTFGVPVAAPAMEPVDTAQAIGGAVPTSGDNPLQAALAGINTADLIDAEETGRKAARLDVANELMAVNPYRQEVPSLVADVPAIDFEALTANLSKAGK